MELLTWLIELFISHLISVGPLEVLFTKLYFHTLKFFFVLVNCLCFVVFILAFMHILIESVLDMFIINILKSLKLKKLELPFQGNITMGVLGFGGDTLSCLFLLFVLCDGL